MSDAREARDALLLLPDFSIPRASNFRPFRLNFLVSFFYHFSPPSYLSLCTLKFPSTTLDNDPLVEDEGWPDL